MVLPASAPPNAALILLSIRDVCVAFTSITASTIRLAALFSWAIRARALASLGRQEPP